MTRWVLRGFMILLLIPTVNAYYSDKLWKPTERIGYAAMTSNPQDMGVALERYVSLDGAHYKENATRILSRIRSAGTSSDFPELQRQALFLWTQEAQRCADLRGDQGLILGIVWSAFIVSIVLPQRMRRAA